MFKYTKHTLSKIEDLFKVADYKIRYEKGNFKSGYCIVENQDIAVINKFFDTEARINSLIEILANIELESSHFDEKQMLFYKKLKQAKLEEVE